MAMSRKEIRDLVLDITRQDNTLNSLINQFINLTLNEINDPGWAFTKDVVHYWNFLRRKNTFSTVANTSDYFLGRDVDKISIVRQTETPIKISQITDEHFLTLIPDPTDTGNPIYYRLWEVGGVSTKLAAADTINVVSSSTSDAGSAELTVSVMGFDSNGIWRTETYQLNGTTSVNGSVTFAARDIFVMKQKDTTGSITVSRNTGSTTLAVLGPQERAPKFKVMTLYPIPSSAITIYLEYYSRIPILNNDSDVPLLPEHWHHLVVMGCLSKVYQYLNKESSFVTSQALYSNTLRSMVNSDKTEPDLIEHLSPQRDIYPLIWQRRTEDAISA